MKLWYSPPSPFARKVRVVATELGLAERIELVLTPVVPIEPNPALVPQNPLVKLPTLEAEDGTVLYDSRTICEYLDALAGGGRLFPATGPARWDALRRQALGDGIMDAGILRRYELTLRPEALRGNRRRSIMRSMPASATRRAGRVRAHSTSATSRSPARSAGSTFVSPNSTGARNAPRSRPGTRAPQSARRLCRRCPRPESDLAWPR